MNLFKRKDKKKKEWTPPVYHPMPKSWAEFKPDFIRRLKETKTTRWIRFALVALLFLLWVAWLENWWVAFWLILLFDIYITGYIPFTWWKRSKSAVTRTIMGWVDAIVYALILVYFVFTFIGQNYQIPSSSLEKSLLVGDYLVVNKMAYGPRVPMTPIHFPLVQNTFPFFETKSYIEWPQWRYHRLKGLGNVERGDIVVFNFPAGDTVATKMPNPDYYTLVDIYGHYTVNHNKEQFGEIIYRPVDRRDNYVKRAVGLPGERIKIVDGIIHINGKPIPQPKNVQYCYYVQFKSYAPTDEEWESYDIAVDDRNMLMFTPEEKMTQDYADFMEYLRQEGFNIAENNDPAFPLYRIPLTGEMINNLNKSGKVVKILKTPTTPGYHGHGGDYLFPAGVADQWTRADYGELWIPQKGKTIDLNENTWKIYNRCIKNYEHNYDAELREDGKVYINGKPQNTYTFQMDYYFMMGDNRDNSLDSRYWGFVPEDHIIGRPEMVLISFDKDKPMFDGGIRWDRMFIKANPDK